jgi:hypothetical protein
MFEKMQNFSHLAASFSKICRQLLLGPGISAGVCFHNLAIKKTLTSLLNKILTIIIIFLNFLVCRRHYSNIQYTVYISATAQSHPPEYMCYFIQTSTKVRGSWLSLHSWAVC